MKCYRALGAHNATSGLLECGPIAFTYITRDRVLWRLQFWLGNHYDGVRMLLKEMAAIVYRVKVDQWSSLLERML